VIRERRRWTWGLGGLVSAAALLLAAGWATPGILSSAQPAEVSGLIAVPDVRQSTDYSCGASALQSVLAYSGLDRSEDELMDALGTDEESGTTPESIVRVATGLGFLVSIREGISLDEIRAALGDRIPVIVALQAWIKDKPQRFTWAETWEEGHYAVVIGMDADYVYLEDPYLLGTRGRIHVQEFEERWHDYSGEAPLDPADRRWVHLGIFIRDGGAKARRKPLFTDVE
jgi:hypothetical protein